MTAYRAFAPLKGIESGVEIAQQSKDVSQLAPAGVPLTTFELSTNTRVRNMTTACGATPTATLAVSPRT